MDKDTARAIADFERLGLFALKLKEQGAELEAKEAELKGAEKRMKDAEAARQSADTQVLAKQAELKGLQNSIQLVNDRLKQDKDKARADFDAFVAGIKAEEGAINAALRKRQDESKHLIDGLVAKEADATKKFDALVKSHEKWKKDHGLA